MTTTSTPNEKKNLTPAEIQKGIEYHKKAATHLEAAAKDHLEAAKQFEAGNHDKAAESKVAAHGHQNLANEAQKEDSKNNTVAAN